MWIFKKMRHAEKRQQVLRDPLPFLSIPKTEKLQDFEMKYQDFERHFPKIMLYLIHHT